MNILRVRCRSRQDFDGYYLSDFPSGGIFCPTTKELPVGTPVVIDLVCKDLPNRVMIRGTVRSWRPALPRMRVRAGASVEFFPDETAKRDFILETMCGSRTGASRRRHARIPLALQIGFRRVEDPENQTAELRELSVNGALLVGPFQPPIGCEVVVEIVPPGSATPMAISGRVMYHSGPDQTGVRFHCREGGGSRRLREVVRRFKAD